MEHQPDVQEDHAGAVSPQWSSRTHKDLPYPLRMLVIGASHTGKTFLIRKMIMRGDLGDKADTTYSIFSPVKASLYQPIWQDLKRRGYRVGRHDKFDDALTAFPKSGRRVLIIDDVDNLTSRGHRLVDTVNTMFTVESHHSDVSVIMISHQFKTGAPAARDSAEFVILTANPLQPLQDLCKQLGIGGQTTERITNHLLQPEASDGWGRCFNHMIVARIPGVDPLWQVDDNPCGPAGVVPF